MKPHSPDSLAGSTRGFLRVVKYRGRRLADGGALIERYSPGARQWLPLPLARSVRLRQYSTTGFTWGQAPGRGGKQAALAILLDFTNDEEAAVALCPDFLARTIARMTYSTYQPEYPAHPRPFGCVVEWQMSGAQIADVIHDITNDRAGRALIRRARSREVER